MNAKTNETTAKVTPAKPSTAAKPKAGQCNNTAFATMLQGHADLAIEKFDLKDTCSIILTGSPEGISASVSIAGSNVFHGTLATGDIHADTNMLVDALKSKVAPFIPLIAGVAMQAKLAAQNAIAAATQATAADTDGLGNPVVDRKTKAKEDIPRALPNAAEREKLLSETAKGKDFDVVLRAIPGLSAYYSMTAAAS